MHAHAARLLALLATLAFLGCDDSEGASDGAPSMLPECGAGMSPPNVSGCTDERIEEYYDCAAAACEPAFAACYGPAYESGVYAGACAPYLECVSGCGCGDATCTNMCDGGEECGACFVEHPCGTECLPNCNAQEGDATCDDLAACCDGMTDPALRADCQATVDAARVLGEMGDAFCAVLYPSLEPFCE